MNKVLILNHKIKECGVYQFGKRLGQILVKSKNVEYLYIEIASSDEIHNLVALHQPSHIIFNYVEDQTCKWPHVKSIAIVHNGNPSHFDIYLHQNPDYQQTGNHWPLARPLFEVPFIPNDLDIINIGSFGFPFKYKYFERICQLVNDAFDEKTRVNINFNWSKAKFSNENIDHQILKQECLSKITKNNITLNVTTEFMEDEELLLFLGKNNLNIVLYDNFDYYNGISSTIDYLLSVRKPIAISRSNMFSHLSTIKPSICIEDSNLITIMNNGFKPLQHKYEEWSNANLIKGVDAIVNR